MQKSQFGALFRKGERVGEVDENSGYVAERERETERGFQRLSDICNGDGSACFFSFIHPFGLERGVLSPSQPLPEFYTPSSLPAARTGPNILLAPRSNSASGLLDRFGWKVGARQLLR